MSIRISKITEPLQPALFSCEASNSGNNMFILNTKVSENFEHVIKMLAVAMNENDNIVSILLLSLAEYSVNTEVDAVKLLKETIDDVVKLKRQNLMKTLFPNQQN